ncbi:variant erythrocyte surface antigen-1 family protein [Babesia caballi]|uniref:Variant erythrocyte surface antigen-1 family protein n=1 Tax=Babesia caballi TaxID=5871 RepID=A0AAV4LNZ6_BABCB|nr:variant erythrocyte surface antigen-1 family protein [Babesia caballi]
MPVVYIGLTDLYWQCTPVAGNSSNDLWFKQQLSQNNELKKFLMAFGYAEKDLNNCKTGQMIATRLKDAFANELWNAYNTAQPKQSPSTSPTYPNFLGELKKPLESKPPQLTSCPLTSLYLISYYYITNFLYIVEPTSPASPSFADYSGTAALAGGAYGLNLGGLGTFMIEHGSPGGSHVVVGALNRLIQGYSIIRPCRPLFARSSNLKEAIDWILSVTGKDGQDANSQGTEAITALSKQVKELLGSVEGYATGLSYQEIENVTKALGSGNDGLISKLADGLQQFIGYDPSGGTIKHNTQGIGMYNDPLERLQDAVLGFVLGMVQNLGKYVQNGQAAIATIVSGKGDFNKAVQNELILNPNSGNDFKNVLNAVKKVTDFKGKSDSLSTLAGAFKEYVKKVLQAVENDTYVKRAIITNSNDVQKLVQELNTNFENVVEQLKPLNARQPIDFGKTELKQHIDKIYNGDSGTFKKLYDAVNSKTRPIPNVKAKALVNAAYVGATYSLSQLHGGYKSYYQGAVWNTSWNNGQAPEAAKCAKIFLACLPLIFNNLGRLFLKCKQNKAHGGWTEMQLDGKGQNGADLKNFMDLMTYSSVRLNGAMTGDNVVTQAFRNINEFTAAAFGQSYAEFLKQFRSTGIDKWKEDHQSATQHNFLSGLYLCSTSYFRHQHQKNAAQARPPSSIREMLYWLMGLTATPQFGDLLGHIHNVVGKDFKVAVSGSSRNDDTLTADQVTSYVLSTCYTSPSVLDIIQGRVPPNASKSEPWLHELYSNAAFPFQYPSSGTALLHALSDCTYALQFQLGFLYQQCSQLYVNTCGWFMCTFGKDVNATLTHRVVKSHICSVGCTTGAHNNSDDYNSHLRSDCEHNGCGENGNNSPLQAFLTDKLKGFSRGHPSGHSGHLAFCSGGLCHVPMGFKAENLRSEPNGQAQGGHISLTLKPYCGNHNAPLRQLCGTLTCLSKRAPRSLGDLFGFMWHVNEQLAKTLGNFDGATWYGDLKNKLPFSHQLTSESGQKLKTFVGTGHSGHSTADLSSLYSSGCKEKGNNCGPYLSPLTLSHGATFGKAAPYASIYLSWMVYLTEDFHEWFQNLLDEFNNIDCTKTECRKFKRGQQACQTPHEPGTHGTNPECSCDSVVHCGGVLPLLYRYGFTFSSLYSLSGETAEPHKRSCDKFHTQLSNVLSTEAPLTKLLTIIDQFLYMFRIYFFYNLSTFWTIYIGLILYTFLFLLDTLHVRSHLKLTSSHTIPPLALLTTGKAPALTQLTYYMP